MSLSNGGSNGTPPLATPEFLLKYEGYPQSSIDCLLGQSGPISAYLKAAKHFAGRSDGRAQQHLQRYRQNVCQALLELHPNDVNEQVVADLLKKIDVYSADHPVLHDRLTTNIDQATA